MSLRDKKIVFLLLLALAIPLLIAGMQALLGGAKDDMSYRLEAQDTANKGDWAGLEVLAREWMKFYPRTAMPYAALGDSYYRRSQVPEATAAYEAALARDANIPEVWARYGATLFNTGRYADALNACGNSIKLRPEFAEPWLCQGLAYAFTGDRNNALKVLEKLSQIAPERAAQMRQVVQMNACPSFREKLGKTLCPA